MKSYYFQVSDFFLREIKTSETDVNGLISKSQTIRLTIERKHSKGNTFELSCVSTFAGIPQSGLRTTKVIPVFDQITQISSNQKYSLYSSSVPKLRVSVNFGMVLSVVRWFVN